jgi:uncharacterized protein (DUF488 family)
MARSVVFTVGYEGRTPDELIELLTRAGVRRVIDVRALPLSRRRGFSKTRLREALGAHGIDYVHLREAGNPYRDLRDDPKRCLRLYARYLDARPAVLDAVAAAASERRAALLCLEARPEGCHRSVIATELAREKRFAVKQL